VKRSRSVKAAEELLRLQGEWRLLEPTTKVLTLLSVRGKRVEELHVDGSRRFFNLVLAAKALGPELGGGPLAKVKKGLLRELAQKGKGKGKGKSTLHFLAKGGKGGEEPTLRRRHALPPSRGPAAVLGKGRGGKGKDKGKSKGPVIPAGCWMLLHHTPKLLLWPKAPGEPSFQELRGFREPVWWHPAEQESWTRGGMALEILQVRYADGHAEELFRHKDEPDPAIWRAAKGFAVKLGPRIEQLGRAAAEAPTGPGPGPEASERPSAALAPALRALKRKGAAAVAAATGTVAAGEAGAARPTAMLKRRRKALTAKP
ncbi:unnamed protein product, partial [Polarella glacialis]